MAKSFLTDLNLNNNVLLNAKIQAWGSAPTGTTNPNGSGTATTGQISSYLGALWIFNGTAWAQVGGGTVTIGSTAVTVNGSAVTTFAGLSSVTSTTFVGALTGNVTGNVSGSAGTVTGLTVSSGKTLTVSNTLTLAGTDSSTLNIGSGGTLASGAFANIGLYATLNAPTFTGTVSGITSAMVGLGNVTNESKATMFSSPTFTGTVSGVTATHVGLGNVTNESKATMFTSPTFTGTVAAFTSGGIAMGNNKITGLGTPTADADAVTKLYVDTIATGLHVHPSVNYATTGALGTTGNLVGGTITTTYANGTSGVDATLTIATSSNWTDILIDGQSLTVNDRVLIKNQGGTASNLQNGIYFVTQVGTVGSTTSFIFKRALDADQSPEIDAGDLTYVVAGTVNGGDGYVQNVNGVTVGTTAIQWSQFSGAGAVPIATTTSAGIASFPTAQFSVDAGGAVTIGTINAGVVNAGTGQISGARGGTGVDNGSKTITVSGNTTIGSSTHTVAFATGGNTTVTLPTTGTLAINSGSQTFTGVQTFTSPSITTSLTTGSTSFDLLNTTATTINFAGAATTLSLGADTTSSSTTNLGLASNAVGGQTRTVNIGTGVTATGANVTVNIATSANTTNTTLVNVGHTSTTTTITGVVRVPTVGTSGFVKAGSLGALSTSAIVYTDLPTSSLTGVTTAGIARKTTGAGTGTSAQSFSVNHGFGQWVTAQLFLTSSGESVEVDITNTSAGSPAGTTTFTSAASNTNWTLYTYVIIG
jgi:hypothetical protein